MRFDRIFPLLIGRMTWTMSRNIELPYPSVGWYDFSMTLVVLQKICELVLSWAHPVISEARMPWYLSIQPISNPITWVTSQDKKIFIVPLLISSIEPFHCNAITHALHPHILVVGNSFIDSTRYPAPLWFKWIGLDWRLSEETQRIWRRSFKRLLGV